VSVIEIENLSITYGNVTAVNGLNLTVNPGEVVGLLGGNGAGKSSTLRAIGGVNPHSAGILRVAGHDMANANESEKARAKVGYCPDVGGLVRQATPREHIALALAFRKKSHLWPQALDLVEHFDLTHVFDRVSQGFSHGMCRRLSVLLATLTAEEALVLDEPFDGVDPLGVEATMTAINNATSNGLGVLISTHLLDLVVASCDRVAVMVGGRVVEYASAAEFAGQTGKDRYANLLRATA
jgi:ABC-2 type transport system ATP-binding protein